MAQNLKLNVRSSILDRERCLMIEPGFIEFDDVNLKNEPPTRFIKSEIASWRYGVKWIRGYKFYIGRIYCIDIKNNSNQVIKLRWKTIYGIRKKELGEKYLAVAQAIQANYMKDITLTYLNTFYTKASIHILGMTISKEGVLLKERTDILPWLDVETKDYQTYFSIFSLKNPNTYRAFYYLEDWNTGVLYSVIRSIQSEYNK